MAKGYWLMHFEMQEAAATATTKVHGMLLNGKESASELEEKEGIVSATFMKFLSMVRDVFHHQLYFPSCMWLLCTYIFGGQPL